jgi:antitoxin (DNA-binding transcriptional repressor) of toxin-antitoxin stability system
MKRSYSIGEAKTQLSKLIAEVERGVDVELRRGKTPVARIVPASAASTARRKPGALKGQIVIGDDFDVLPDDVARALGMID